MKQNSTGVYRLDNGLWEYRFIITVNGKKKMSRRRKDDDGEPFRTKKEAMKARERAIEQARLEEERTIIPIARKTMEEVFDEYCEKGRAGKAYQTKRKQDSLWNNHIKPRFGKRYVDDISTAEVNDYLTELYYVNDLAYRYVESFLKMFYLIFGQAYSRNYMAVDTYNKLCMNKGARIAMPKLKIDEDTDIQAFSKEEMAKLDSYFTGSNGETAYLLGRYCGLRINECYGLRWENVDIEKGTILIDRQMQYQEGLIKMVHVKTRNAKRTVYMNDRLKAHFQKLWAARTEAELSMPELRRQNQTIIIDLDGSPLSSLDLVNSLPNGKIQTVNSMKYHSRTIQEQLKIPFKFHYLRHTYGTMMADLNTPTHLLCDQMGHGNIHVTQKYYLALSETGVDILNENLNRI